MGYLRRSEPARGYGQPMEATALVLDDGTTRIVLVGADLGRPAPFAPEAGEELVRHALELTTELFERGPSAR